MGIFEMETCKTCRGKFQDLDRHLQYSKIYGGKCHRG